ncbi:hypothetical protein JG688_00017778 [Phytophthora aleatoria]|uniref:Uncharacterized protein n=1 Tax=Phytophthora aleatoria TaxID=2496075 RepID=A0A8J5LYB4_9STRA|nr:hypothetical protein JG688_00017778 [Phytophthora aleatoria]
MFARHRLKTPRPTSYQRLQQLLAERQSAEAASRVITSVEELKKSFEERQQHT